MWKKLLLSRFKWTSGIILLIGATGSAEMKPAGLSVSPNNPLLFGKDAHQALLVLVSYSDGTSKDVTGQAHFVSAKPGVATVDSAGQVIAHADGGSRIDVSYGGVRSSTTVLVQKAEAPVPL